MDEEVVQWLAEIKRLKQQLAQTQQALQTCKSRELKWRQHYTEEAQQRRTEVRLAAEQLAQAELSLQALQQNFLSAADTPETSQALWQELAAITDLDLLKQQLFQVTQERNRALQTLQLEQQHHRQTQENLTSVINDLVEQLNKYRQRNDPE
ncbi:hypothetical protein NIES970_20240 [[Synechococcus] sp. NIES-970]|nr:hypothetical protein NIES970_20240 [[Synechococcus] sp. NIES-970]